MNDKRICFITCVKDLELYNECFKYLSNLDVPEGYEVENIYIEEAESITKAYNEAMKASNAKYKVYLHEDTFIINKNFIFDILDIFQNNKNIGLLGIVGAKTISARGVWQDSGHKYGKVYDSHTSKMQLLSYREIERDFEPVEIIDGFIMATQYDIPWREEAFDGWYFYDISQSVEFVKAGYKVVVPRQEEPWVIHDYEEIRIEKEYDHYRQIFLKEYSSDIFPLVSILIPTYNRPEYFQLALDSALNQTYKNTEIIIGDDSTNNETEELVKKYYLNRYPNIKYFHNEKNIGQFDNDLKLYNMAEGEFINFLMDDDLFNEAKIQKMIEYFIQDTAKEISLVTSHREIIDDKGNAKGIFHNTDKIFKENTIIDGIQLGNFMLKFNFNCIGEPTTVLFRKENLKEPFGMFNGRRYGCNVDQASWLNLLSQNKAVFINDRLSYFRIHSGQQQQDLKIMIRGFADYAHEILTCREKGFLQDSSAYFEAIINCLDLCKEHIIDPLSVGKTSIKGHVDYNEFIKCYNELVQRYMEHKKQTGEMDCVSKVSYVTIDNPTVNLDCNNNAAAETKVLPLVSILIPAYNQTTYLKEALESAVNQTYTNIEIIIGDDSTNDEVEKFVKPYIEQYNNIIYYKNERTKMDYGVSNVEGLFKRSRGEYINYLFHDDIFHVEKIERMMNNFLNQKNISLVTSHRQLIDEKGKLLPDNGATKRILEKDTLVNGNQLSLACLESLTNFIGEPTTVLFKKALLEEGFGYFNGNSYMNIGDLAMWFSLLQKGHAVYMVDSLSYFRQHSAQNSQKLEVYATGVIEWKNIIVDSYKSELVTGTKMYKELISKWFYEFSQIIKTIAVIDLDHNLKRRLQETFKEAIDILMDDESNIH